VRADYKQTQKKIRNRRGDWLATGQIKTKTQDMKNKVLAAFVAAILLGTFDAAKAQDTFNVRMTGISGNSVPNSWNGYMVPAHAAITFYLMGVDLSQNMGSAVGGAYASVQTTSGTVLSSTNPFTFDALVSGTLSQFGFSWASVSGGAVDSGGYVDATVPSGFSFNTISDYQQFFNLANANGFASLSLNNIPITSQAFEVAVAPDPSSITVGNIKFTNGGFNFNITGPTGTNVVIEASTNLQSWLPLATNSLVNGTNYFTDPQPANYPRRFYRVRTQ